MDKIKIVAILGSTGMAGHVISKYLEEQKHEVHRISRSERNDRLARCYKVDIMDFSALEMTLKNIRPDVIINCIGVLNRTCDESPEVAVQLNSLLPHWLSAKARESGSKVIHLSTDCVFSGNRGSYKESDFKDGDTFYDRSKALGELNNTKDLTFRMSIIGPDITPNGIGLFNWFMKQTGVIYGYKHAIWNGITTICLAQAIEKAISVDLTGLYHLVPNTEINKFDLISLFKEVFEKDDVVIRENIEFTSNKSLINTRTDFDFIIPSYRDMICQMHDWIINHSELYQKNYIQKF